MSLLEAFQRLTTNRRPLQVDSDNNLYVVQGLPKYARLAAEGKLFAFDTHAGTAKAPVTAPPTTSPEWALYNFSKDEYLVVLTAAITLISGTAGLGLALMGAVAAGLQTPVTADYASTIKSCLDGSRTQPDFYVTNNPTLINTPAWVPLDATKVNSVATNSVGDSMIAPVEGQLIAKPNGGVVAFEAVGETGTTALYSVSGIAAMVKL